MSDNDEKPVSLEFVLRRIDSLNNNVNDMRRSHIALQTRFDGMEARFGAMEARFGSMETRFIGVETWLGAMETRLDHAIVLLEQIARIAGIPEVGLRLPSQHGAPDDGRGYCFRRQQLEVT